MLKYFPALLVVCGWLVCVDVAQAVQYDQNIYLFQEGNSDPTTESNNWTLNSGSNPGGGI